MWNSAVNRMYYACFHIFREFTKDEVDNLYPQTLFLIGEVDRLLAQV